MTDMLKISALRVTTHIGLHAWEQKILQPLLLDIQIPIDMSNCQDDITKTIDYAQLCQSVTTLIESNTYTLIETVAENVASHIKDVFAVTTLTVTVSKPHAIKNAGNISVTIAR